MAAALQKMALSEEYEEEDDESVDADEGKAKKNPCRSQQLRHLLLDTTTPSST